MLVWATSNQFWTTLGYIALLSCLPFHELFAGLPKTALNAESSATHREAIAASVGTPPLGGPE